MKTKQKIIEIFDTEKEGMFRYASYRLQDMKDVEDAMHNLYVKLLSKPELVAGVANLRAYVYRALCNECTSSVKARSKFPAESIDSFEALSSDEMLPENFEQEFALINKLLALLPEEQSETIRLHLHGGLTFRQIARIMDVPLPTAKARFRYGIVKLRGILRKKDLL